MKVMTNQMEARGLQSRTEVRQTVAQMAAPNFKDSAPEDSPRAGYDFPLGKLILCSGQTGTLLRANSYFAPSKVSLCFRQAPRPKGCHAPHPDDRDGRECVG